jgi:hypothetical protein
MASHFNGFKATTLAKTLGPVLPGETPAPKHVPCAAIRLLETPLRQTAQPMKRNHTILIGSVISVSATSVMDAKPYREASRSHRDAHEN